MSDQAATSLADLKARMQRQSKLKQDHQAVCEEMSQAYQHLQAVEVYLEQATTELNSLEGVSLTGLLYAMAGKKDERLRKARADCAALTKECKQYAEKIESLENQVEKIEARLAEFGDTKRLYEQAVSRQQAAIESEGGESAGKLVQLGAQKANMEKTVAAMGKALDAGEQALKDLRDEVHVMGSMGRVRTAEGNALFRAMVNSSRKSAVDECASRARSAVRRFRSKLTEAIGKHADAELTELDAMLAGLSGDVRSGKYDVQTVNYAATDEIDQRLQAANLLVEKKIVDAKNEIERLDAEMKRVIEGR